MAEHDAPNEVGYGKPPCEGRFQKGVSGNPKGRPRGTKNLALVVLKESRQMVRINGPNGSRKVTKLEAAMMQLGNRSAQGDLRASREFFALVERSEESMASGAGPVQITELDQQVMESIRRRMSSFQPTGEQPEQKESK